MKNLKHLIEKNRKISKSLKITTKQYEDLKREKLYFIDYLCCLPYAIYFFIKGLFYCSWYYIRNSPRYAYRKAVACYNFTLKSIFWVKNNFLNILIVVLFSLYISIDTVKNYKSSCYYNLTNSGCVKNLIEIDTESYFYPEVANNLSIRVINNLSIVLEKDKSFKFKQGNLTRNSFQLYSEMFVRFKNVLESVYSELKILQACPKVTDQFKGVLDSKKILQKANLTDLVQFYDTHMKFVWLHSRDVNSSLNPEEETTKAEVFKQTTRTTPKKTINCSMYEIFKNQTVSGDKSCKLELNNSTIKELNKNETDVKNTINSAEHIGINDEYWNLWNTNNMSLLNSSKEWYGHDGKRIELGGYWRPLNCLSGNKVAIIIPYRDRLPHLKVLLYYLHMILQRQMHEYRIFVVEPITPLNISFNKGRVMNAAYLEALKIDYRIECFIFHDVDMIPDDDRIMYSCPQNPRHLSVAVDKFNYILPYDHLVGGVFAISKDHYRKLNGYSNSYWGWGGEDDDLAVRIKTNKLRVIRPPRLYNRFKMMKHKPQKKNKRAENLLSKASIRQDEDGLNTVDYKVVNITLYTGFTHILVNIGDIRKKTDLKRFEEYNLFEIVKINRNYMICYI